MGNNNTFFRSSASEVASSSLFNNDSSGEEEEEEEEPFEIPRERQNRWLLDSSFDEDEIAISEIKSSRETFGDLLNCKTKQNGKEIISTILILSCFDFMDDLLNLRLVCRSFRKIVDTFDFISFQVLQNNAVGYMVDDEGAENKQLCCKRMKIVKKILESKLNTIPQFISNNIKQKSLTFNYILNERENVTKILNPFNDIVDKCKLDTAAAHSHFQIPSIEMYLEMNSYSYPINFTMILISEETSSFEEYLFRYTISISPDGWETKVFPKYKRHFFSSPKNASHQHLQPHTTLTPFSNTHGKFIVKFSLSNDSKLEISRVDILHRVTINEFKESIPLLSDEAKITEGDLFKSIREVKISCSSSNLINVCKRVSFGTKFEIS